MISRLIIVLIGIFFSFQSLSQTLTISSATETSFHSYSAGVLTISGTSNINASTIQGYLSSGNLLIKGSTTALTVNVNQNISTNSASNLTIGESTNTGTITLSNDITLVNSLTIYGNSITLNVGVDLTSTAASGDISLLAKNGFVSVNDATSPRQIFTNGGGDINIDAGIGTLQICYLRLNSNTGNISLKSNFLWWPATTVTERPWLNGTGPISIESNGQYILTAWFEIDQDNNGIGGLTIGNLANDKNITLSKEFTVAGDVFLYGDIVTLDGNLSTTNNGNISIYSDKAIGLATNRNVTCSGVFTYAPRTTSFAAATVSYPISNLTLNANGLTLGKSENTKEMTIASSTSIAGPVSIYGSNIQVNSPLTCTSLGGSVLIKSTTHIKCSASVTTNGGDITLWSNSNNTDAGGIFLTQNVSLDSRTNSDRTNNTNTTGGGNITLSGGAALNTGFAWEYGGSVNAGVILGQITSLALNSNIKLLSGSGNILIRAKTNTAGLDGTTAIMVYQGSTLDAGTNGNITLVGVAENGTGSWSVGMDLASYRAAGYGANLFKTVNGIITMDGQATGTPLNVGVAIDGTGTSADRITLLASGNGSISLVGSAGTGTSNRDVRLSAVDLLVKGNSGGQLSIVAKNAGLATNNMGNGSIVLGSNGSTLTSSTANITLTSPSLTLGAATNLNTSGTFTLEPFATSFSNDISFPITSLTVASTISGLTLGKSGNLANITFSSATALPGPITAYGGTINVNANLSSTLNGAAISLQGTKVVHSPGVTVQTTAGNITYTAANSPWTASSDQCILVGSSGNSTLSTLNAQGGNISLSGSFATTGVTNTSASPNPDVAIMLYDSKLQTSGFGTITINGNAYNNESVNSNFIWGVMFVRNSILQTQNGNISVTGRPGKLNIIGRGIIADGTNSNQPILKALSSTGTIQFTESMPAGHSNNNYTGAYFKPSTTAGTVQFGADGTLVQNSSSNIIFDVDLITFDGTNPTVFNTTGTITIQPVSDAFKSSVSFSNISVPSITGLTIGKSTNTENLSIGSTTAVNGPITLYGGALTLNGALSTTNTTTGNMSLNGTTLTGGSLAVADGRTLTMKLSSNTNYTGAISGAGLHFVKDGSGILKLPTPSALSFAAMTISGGGFTLNPNQQLSLTGLLTNNGTFTMKDGATFLQKTSGTSIEGNGTFKVEKLLTGNSNATWSNTSGRFWYMGVPMVSVARSSYGTYGASTNRLWSYAESTKSYTELTSGIDALSAGTGYVHRRSTNDTLIFSAIGAAGLYRTDFSASGLTKTTGHSAGYHLISNPYMAYVDWHAVYTGATNMESTYYIRSNNSTNTNISALISYNQSTALSTNNSSVTATHAQLRYIAPLQSVWVRVAGAAGSTGSLSMTRGMLSHQTGNVGLKSSTVFPNLARVNLVDGNDFDQLLVYLNSDMSNEVDEYDSEKMPVAGTVQVYTMSSNKKLVMNGLKNNKKKVSVPLYLELPQTKSYTLQLSEYQVEDGLILLEDKQEGTIQDFTLMDNYTFYANSGLLQNRFVLHFILPNAELAPQGPSNSWVEAEEGSYTEGGDVEILNDAKGNIEITLNQALDTKVEGTVFVTDMNGKEVYSGQLEGIITAIELDVPSGIYYLTVQSGTLIEKKKVFIQE